MRSCAHLQRGKVDDAVDIGVSLEDLVKGTLLRDINLDELWLLSRNELNAVDDLLGRVVEIVHDHDLVARLNQGESCEGANVARSSAGVRRILAVALVILII